MDIHPQATGNESQGRDPEIVVNTAAKPSLLPEKMTSAQARKIGYGKIE